MIAPPSRGEIVLVRFFYEVHAGTVPPQPKLRPCLVLSSDWYHSGRDEVIVAAITSNQRRVALPGELAITHWQEAGLLKPSVATMILRTVKRTVVEGSWGHLVAEDMEEFSRRMRKSLGL